MKETQTRQKANSSRHGRAHRCAVAGVRGAARRGARAAGRTARQPGRVVLAADLRGRGWNASVARPRFLGGGSATDHSAATHHAGWSMRTAVAPD
eukprot:352958-Chlamydomonas_euryale.AAC.15